MSERVSQVLFKNGLKSPKRCRFHRRARMVVDPWQILYPLL